MLFKSRVINLSIASYLVSIYLINTVLNMFADLLRID